MSTISITGITAIGFHGVYDEERRKGQPFIVDVVMDLDTSTAEKSDDVNDSVDYGEVAEEVAKIISGEPVSLIETLAARIADAVMTRDTVKSVAVTVHKPGAPIVVTFTDVSVTVRRSR